MARSYGRLKRRKTAGVLVREAPVQVAMSSNSLYCIPLKKTFAVDANGVTALSKTAAHSIRMGGTGSGSTGPEATGVIRVSSALVSSQSPFTIEVMNSAGTYTTFQIPGQKVVKVPFSRENSIAGNAALFNSGNSSVAGLLKIQDMESPVDVRINVVIDGALDD